MILKNPPPIKSIDNVYFKYCKFYWDLFGYCIPGIVLSVKMLIFSENLWLFQIYCKQSYVVVKSSFILLYYTFIQQYFKHTGYIFLKDSLFFSVLLYAFLFVFSIAASTPKLHKMHSRNFRPKGDGRSGP